MIIIGAMSRDRIIGRGDGLPWHVPEEYAQFLRLIEDQTVIIGRRSYQIYGKDMRRSHLVVVSRSGQRWPGAMVAPSVEAAVERAGEFETAVYSAGGSSIYRQTLPLADTMYLSYIKGTYEGDAYFPAFDTSEWRIARREDHPRFEFVVYHRR